MPFTFKVNSPAVVITTEVIPAGEYGRAMATGFFSSEDGNTFIRTVEALANHLSPVFRTGRMLPSMVDTFLAVIQPDGRVTAYCNELVVVLHFRSRRAVTIKAGEVIGRDDIADIHQVELRTASGAPVSVPPECGVVVILSLGWRKMVYFDFSVLVPHGQPRREHLPRLFGRFFARLMFQEMYAISEPQWNRLLEWGWFPFIGLRDEDRRVLLSMAFTDRDPTPIFANICRHYAAGLGARLEAWKKDDHLNRQMPFLLSAKERYDACDYVSCISILYLRIEGVMRTLFGEENPSDEAKSGAMVANLIENQCPHSLLLPDRFAEYLRQVYFRKFNLSLGNVKLSRNSHAHGVSDIGEYDFVRASVGFMILDQIHYYLSD